MDFILYKTVSEQGRVGNRNEVGEEPDEPVLIELERVMGKVCKNLEAHRQVMGLGNMEQV